MMEEHIKEVLDRLEKGEISAAKAMESLRDLPYRDIGFANVDNHRTMRTGFPEVIYCQGKTPRQIRDIFRELTGDGGSALSETPGGRTIFATRATRKDYETVKEAVPQAEYFETARIIAVKSPEEARHGRIAVVTAGTADIPVAEEAAVTAELLGNTVSRIYDVGVAGIHRLFDKIDEIRSAHVIIVIAGMEGALASVVGGLVDIPVIAVPTSVGYGSSFEGLASLLSMLNSCANGVTVVNIDNGFGAAYAASVITRRIT